LLGKIPQDTLGREIERLGTEAQIMLKQSIQSFAELDDELARSTIKISASMEYNLDIIYQELTANQEPENAKDTLAIFVIFSQLKRIADQAKNICEETIFAVTGQQKKPKVYKVLFVDEDNSYLTQLAQFIAKKNYPDICLFTSVGRNAAADVNQKMIAFLTHKGADVSNMRTRSLSDISLKELSEQHVVISLQGDINNYYPKLPFHTCGIQWDVTNDLDAENIETTYRSLSLQIQELVELLHGDEV